MTSAVRRILPLLAVLVLPAGCAWSPFASSSSSSSCSSEVVFKALPGNGQPVTAAGMQIAANILTNRLDRIGVASPTVSVFGDEITLRVAGIRAPIKTTSFVISAGALQVFDFEKDLAAPTVDANGNPTPYGSLYALLTTMKDEFGNGKPAAYYLFSATHAVLAGPAPTQKDLLAARGGRKLSGTTILTVPANREVVSGTRQTFTGSTRPVGTSTDGLYWYFFKDYPNAPNGPPEISASDIDESVIHPDISPDNGQPEVTLGFTRHGAKEFQAITKAEYGRGQLIAGLHGAPRQLNQLYAQHNAIVLDGKLQATPYIDYTDTALSLGISGASVVISNLGSMNAANNLALVLQSGSLPYTFERVKLHICSP